MPYVESRVKYKVPERIYLQVTTEDGEWPDEVTWCVDRINDSDIEYRRVGVVLGVVGVGEEESDGD